MRQKPLPDQRVEPLSRSGRWTSEGDFGPWAKWCLVQAEEHLSKARQGIEHARASGAQPPADTFTCLQRGHLFANAAVVFAAMAVEGFLNFYGVVRLGEHFYKAYYERSNIPAKTASLIATCSGTLIGDGNELLVVARRVWERRNRLVHPKTREEGPSTPKAPTPLPSTQEAREAVADMDRFFQLFGSHDEDAARWLSLLQSSSLTSA